MPKFPKLDSAGVRGAGVQARAELGQAARAPMLADLTVAVAMAGGYPWLNEDRDAVIAILRALPALIADNRTYKHIDEDLDRAEARILELLDEKRILTGERDTLRADNERLRAERLKLDKRIRNQRVALRQDWQIWEMRNEPGKFRAMAFRWCLRLRELVKENVHLRAALAALPDQPAGARPNPSPGMNLSILNDAYDPPAEKEEG